MSVVETEITLDQIKTRVRQLIARRGVIRGKITKFINFIKDVDEFVQINYVEKKLENLTQDTEELRTIEADLINLDPEGDHETVFEDIWDDYHRGRAIAKRLITISRQQSAAPNVQTIIPQTSDSSACNLMKIPKVELKKFDGSLEKWRSYRY